jgi:Tfp pilus assembly protein PilO
MSAEKSKKRALQVLLKHLRHPIELRMVICVALLAGWYFGFYSPLTDKMAATQAQITQEKRRIVVAHQIDAVRDAMTGVRDRVPAKSDTNELIQHVMAQIQTSPLKLIDLKPDKAITAGPYTTLALKLVFEGTYAEFDDLLTLFKNDRRLLRVDALSLTPATNLKERKQGQLAPPLNIQLTLTSLAETAVAETPPG